MINYFKMLEANDYRNLLEPPHFGMDITGQLDKPRFTVRIGGRDLEVISVRLDSEAEPPLMPTWLFLRVEPGITVLLHTCGDGSGWREVDEGAPDFIIRSGTSSQGYMVFTCLKCTSIHRMRSDGAFEWSSANIQEG